MEILADKENFDFPLFTHKPKMLKVQMLNILYSNVSKVQSI